METVAVATFGILGRMRDNSPRRLKATVPLSLIYGCQQRASTSNGPAADRPGSDSARHARLEPGPKPAPCAATGAGAGTHSDCPAERTAFFVRAPTPHERSRLLNAITPIYLSYIYAEEDAPHFQVLQDKAAYDQVESAAATFHRQFTRLQVHSFGEGEPPVEIACVSYRALRPDDAEAIGQAAINFLRDVSVLTRW